MNVTKREMVLAIQKGTNDKFIQPEILSIVDAFLWQVRENLKVGNDVELRGFGSFRVKEFKPRVGRNPKVAGSVIAIPAKKKVKFKATFEI